MKKILFLSFVMFLTTTVASAQCGNQPCPSGQQQQQVVQVDMQATPLPLDEKGNVKLGTYQANIYILKTPDYSRTLSVLFIMAGSNTIWETNGVFTQKTPMDWTGFFVRSQESNLKNIRYSNDGTYNIVTGKFDIVGGDYIKPLRIPALLHFDGGLPWAELLLK